MKKTVIKFYSNFEKEEQWLNRMAAQGWHCTDYALGRYVFEKGEPGEYIYRLQLLDYPAAHAESAAYLAFLEETGVEVIATWFRWVFLRKKAADGPFEIFSDRESRISHYKKVIAMLLPITIFNLIMGMRALLDGPRLYSVNLFAGVIAIFPLISYYQRTLLLHKEGRIRE